MNEAAKEEREFCGWMSESMMPKYVYEIAVTATTNFFDTDNVDWKFGKFHKVLDEGRKKRERQRREKIEIQHCFVTKIIHYINSQDEEWKTRLDTTFFSALLPPPPSNYAACSAPFSSTHHTKSQTNLKCKNVNPNLVSFSSYFSSSLFLYLIIIVQRHTKKTMKIHNEDS